MQKQPFYSCNRFLSIFFASLILSLSLSYFPSMATQVIPAHSANQLVQQGVNHYQEGEILTAIEMWQKALEKTEQPQHQAIIWENLARAYGQIGQNQAAINHWNDVIAYYQQENNLQKVGRLLTEQAQNHSNIGQSRQGIQLLCGTNILKEDGCQPGTAVYLAQVTGDNEGETAALGSLGEAYRQRGKYQEGITFLRAAETKSLPNQRPALLNSLGNTYVGQGNLESSRAESARKRGAENKASEFKKDSDDHYEDAEDKFGEALAFAQKSNNQWLQLKILLNLTSLYFETEEPAKAEQHWRQAYTLLEKLPNSQNKVYAIIDLVNFGNSVQAGEQGAGSRERESRECLDLGPEMFSQAETLLNQAISIAKSIQDDRSLSFALGKLGHLYECQKDYTQALAVTQQARLAAKQNRDSLYLWDWQAARIYLQQGKENEALKAYEKAIATLEKIRNDILTANRDLQFDFRDNINPIYRELAELNLQRGKVGSALETIDSLKLAEILNYFGNDCELTLISEERVDELVGPNTAVFSSLIFENRTAIVLSLRTDEPKIHWLEVDNNQLRAEINDFRRGLENFSDKTYDLQRSQKLYDWLIRPFEQDLQRGEIKTLVFIQDGILRSVPMAALHDGEKYLVETYSLATTPSLRLTKLDQQLERKALILASTKKSTVEGEFFTLLPNVGKEIRAVKAKVTSNKLLLNEKFTKAALRKDLEEDFYPILHIATHAKFGTIPEDTFLVIGNNEKLDLVELEKMLRKFSSSAKPLELLALTACETAVGDDRSTLGLGGIAVQSGVRSALASLWSIPDAPTVDVVRSFYENLAQGKTKAEALQNAQIQMIEQKHHPASWAAFILIGNWL